MNHAADNIRLLAVSMVETAKSGHPGGAMGGADFINVLFSEFLVFDPDQPTWEGRDRFYLDPGHMSPMLYSALALQGKYTIDDLKTFRQWGTICPGHPERDIIHGIENTSGPLGQGHTYAVGAAIAEKFLEARLGSTMMQHKIYAYISDGGVQEEISQGAGRIAGLFKLNNLIMFYDANEIQLSTECDVVMRENTRMKYESWGWNVLEINGNAPDEIRAALILANKEENRPTLIIGHTVMAKGARKEDGSSYERSVKTHGAPLGGGAYENTVKNLGGDLNDPFVVFDDVKELYEKRNAELREIVKERHAAEEEWRKANPEKAEQMKAWFSGDAPKVDWSALVQKRDVATRVASANCLGVLAEQVPNMVCSSADLCNSDKTDGFLKKTHELAPDDFTGAFLAALMRVPIKFVWSHDAFRVGEDGPTHEPVEQEAQIRLMEKLKNHKGQDSVRVFRPADADETTVCWQMANENMDTPTAMICSRQNVNSLPEGTDYSQVRKGAYIVKDDPNYDVILLASGSEVSTLLAGAELLNADGVKTRIVSVPSEGLFRTQSKEYQESVLPKGAKIFGMTAGLPVTLQSLVGVEGMVYGLESFGFSAPYKVLDEKLGFNAENVYKQVKDYLSK